MDRHLETYFKCCSMAMSCRDLARAAGNLICPTKSAGERFAVPDVTSRLMSLMRICGLYDISGEFAYRVGIPAKSGIGGGIIAVCPEKFSVCVWSPALDRSGNSVAGLHALEEIVTSDILT
jgi:glutaminase